MQVTIEVSDNELILINDKSYGYLGCNFSRRSKRTYNLSILFIVRSTQDSTTTLFFSQNFWVQLVSQYEEFTSVG
jgi:hypothetical protein